MQTQTRFYLEIRRGIILLGLTWALTMLSSSANHMVLAQPNPSLLFIENVGQFHEATHFQAQGDGATLSLTNDALWFTIIQPPQPNRSLDQDPEEVAWAIPEQGLNLRLSFINANPNPRLEPFNRLETRVSYFTGSDPADWHPEVPVWGGVRYVDLYPGIDLEITGENGQLLQRLVIKDQPDAAAQNTGNLTDIALRVEGAEALAVDEAGRLHLDTAIGEITLPLLQLEQADMQIASTTMAPQLEGDIVIRPFSATANLNEMVQTADASDLLYSTFLGGNGNMDAGRGIAVDETGHAYVTGQAYPGFPTTPGVFDPAIDGVESDAFLVKLTPDGSSLDFATFLGGTDFDTARGLALDEAENVYLTGYTKSTDFPTSTGAVDTSYEGFSEVFVAKINPTGTELLYSTLLGGNDTDLAFDMAVDEAGNAYVTGFTVSPDFPTTPDAFDRTLDIWYDIFVAKLNADATALAYSTLIGGNNADYTFGLDIDGAGNAYVTGYTHSTDFPVTSGALDTTYDSQEAFVVKVNADGTGLVYATYLGGTETEYTTGIFVDEGGHAYVTGTTRSPDFPVTPGAYDPSYNTTVLYGGDAFITKLTPDGSEVAYATFLGGSENDVGQQIVLDEAGNIYVTGDTASVDFPTTPDAFDQTCESCTQTFPPRTGFVAKLNPDGSTLSYSTYLGGDSYDRPEGLAADNSGHVYVTGDTSSLNFPTTSGAFDTIHDGFNDAFVTKLATGVGGSDPTPVPTPVPAHNCAPTYLGDITVGDTPRGIAVDPARQRVYVANFGSGSVSVIDSSTNTAIKTINGIPAANGIAHDALHNMLWVTNYDANQVTPIEINGNATSFTVLQPLDVGAGPWGVVYDGIYGLVYVANSLDNSVSIVDANARAVIGTLASGFSQPYHLATTPVTGKVYAANFGNNSVTVMKGGAVSKVVDLYDSAQPYGIAVDEHRNLVYVTTVATNRIVAIGALRGAADQFLGWAAFYRGFGDRNRPVPLRAIAVNQYMGPAGDGGHLWSTTATSDGSEQNQALLIPKGWTSYFHYPLAQNVGDHPGEGVAIDSLTNRVYVSSGTTPGLVTVIGDHVNLCPGVGPASTAEETGEFDFELFIEAALTSGDVTGDGKIDILDLAFIAARFGSADPNADVNGDGKVDILDLATVAQNYGQVGRPTD